MSSLPYFFSALCSSLQGHPQWSFLGSWHLLGSYRLGRPLWTLATCYISGPLQSHQFLIFLPLQTSTWHTRTSDPPSCHTEAEGGSNLPSSWPFLQYSSRVNKFTGLQERGGCGIRTVSFRGKMNWKGYLKTIPFNPREAGKDKKPNGKVLFGVLRRVHLMQCLSPQPG